MKERNYGIDLLRLVLMYMVCILHTVGRGGIIAACQPGTTEYKVYWLMKICAYCAVDGFAIISGYMASDKQRKYSKLVDMWFQAFFYSFIMTVILKLIGIGDGFTVKEVLKAACPVLYGNFWYFTAYFALFFAIPVLNRFLFSIDINTAKKAFVIIIILFSAMEIMIDPFVLKKGYSAFWIIILYCVGVLAKRIRLFEEKKTVTLALMWIFCVGLTWAVFVFEKFSKLITYVSPTMLLCGLIMVVLFSRIKLKGKVVSKLSPLAFGIYLFQLNRIMWIYIIKNRFVFVAEKSVPVGVLYVFAIAFAIFASGLVVEFIRSKLAKLIKLSGVSEAVVKFADKALLKVSAVLK